VEATRIDLGAMSSAVFWREAWADRNRRVIMLHGTCGFDRYRTEFLTECATGGVHATGCLKSVPEGSMGTTFTNAISCFEPGPHEP
jgi:hypothetical protein